MGDERSFENSRTTATPTADVAHPPHLAVQARQRAERSHRAQIDEIVQLVGTPAARAGGIHATARKGIAGSGAPLPHLDAIQHSFGHHDVARVQSHVGGAATQAADQMGAQAYATGNHVAFAQAPDLHTASHEAAHVVQQRAGVALEGGVGRVGDPYERHADAVADEVVAGRSAEALLDRMAGGTGGQSQGSVQARASRDAVQFDIKSDLREAMDGWGTDESGIHARLGRATVEELRVVMADPSLMNELRSELGHDDMRRVLDALRAPIADKLALAMDGWGTDEGYIHRTLLQATPAELATVAANTALVERLKGELSGDDIRRVLDRLNLPLAQKLRYAIEGWGTDEAYIYTSITAAPIAEVITVASDAALIAAIDADLSGEELHQFRGTLAKRIYLEGANPQLAFRMIAGSDGDRAARLPWIGDITQQRALLDVVITTSTDADHVMQAFESYWDIDSSSTDGAPASWPAATVRHIHTQMKLLPDQDTRAGVWQQLVLTGDPDLINRAAWNGRDLIIGANASTASTVSYGHGTKLTANAATGATTINVVEPDRFSANETIAISRNRPDQDITVIKSIANTQYTIEPALTHAHLQDDPVTPNDATAAHDVNWLAATVRHEIAHAVETSIGGVTGFTQGHGGWWTGDAFDTWAAAMGTPWATNDGSTISDTDKAKIKEVIISSVKGRKGSLWSQSGIAADHPVKTYRNKGVAVIEAAEACLAAGDRFHDNPQNLRRANGKVFTVSWWYKNFMYFNESVVAQRVNNYSLYAPAEFFAEVYTVYYEEAGSVPPEQLGQLIRVGAWRSWIKQNIHDRGHAPTAAPAAGATGGGATPGAQPAGGAPRGGAAVGRRANNPGA